LKIDLGGVSVMIGMPVYGRMPPKTALSLADTMFACGAMGIACDLVMETGIVEQSRDALLDDFLRGDKQKLFWIDSDMAWRPDDFMRLLALSTQRSVVAATYPAKSDALSFQVQLSGPTGTVDDLGLMEVRGLGLGFTIVDRAVCQQLADKAPKIKDPSRAEPLAAVFRFGIEDGKRLGEDIAFFSDIRALGHRVWLDTRTDLGHIGEREWTGTIRDAFQPKKELDL